MPYGASYREEEAVEEVVEEAEEEAVEEEEEDHQAHLTSMPHNNLLNKSKM